MTWPLWLGCGAPPVVCPAGTSLQEQLDGEFATAECLDPSGVREGPRLRTLHGAPIWRQQWHHGLLDGEMEIYEGGHLANTTRFAAGVREGRAEGFHPDGSLLWSGGWVAGRAQGDFAFYAPDDPTPRFVVTVDGGEPAVGGLQRRVAGPLEVSGRGDAAVDDLKLPEFFPFERPPPHAELAVRQSTPGEAFPIAWRTCDAACGPWTWAVPFLVLGGSADPPMP